MSREKPQQHHSGRASKVSIDLIHEKELSELFAPFFDVDVVISNDRMYQVAGTRRKARSIPTAATATPMPTAITTTTATPAVTATAWRRRPWRSCWR